MDVTSVTSHLTLMTGASDAELYAASVPSVATPSHVGPRPSGGGQGCERDVDVRACEEGAEISRSNFPRLSVVKSRSKQKHRSRPIR